jgi:ribose-phosphate pyrophosphokinase
LKMKIITGNANPKLAEEIAAHCFAALVPASVSTFADGESSVEFLENIRGEDVFIVQSTATPVNDSLMELLIMIDAARRSSASRITAVIPYFGYARQDRKSASRTPITAKLVANLLVTAGADRILTMDMFNGDIAIVDKMRPEAGKSEVMNLIGDVKGKHAILVDDIVDSGGTLCKAAEAIMEAGALSVRAYITHGVLSGEACQRVEKSVLDELVVTNTITNRCPKNCKKTRQVSVAPLFGEAMRRVTNEESVSSLFV